MVDPFLTQDKCDKCGGNIGTVRKMCWFTEDVMCSDCISEQDRHKQRMRMAGMNVHEFEGCGYTPEVVDLLLED